VGLWEWRWKRGGFLGGADFIRLDRKLTVWSGVELILFLK
jgi:hypothetical protein